MRIMLDNSPKRIKEKSAKYGCEMWQLRTPLTCHKITDIPYGLDNGCFSGNLKHKTWVRMLDEAGDNREKSYPLFVTLPDVVGSARRTLELFEMYEPQTNGLPRCLVLQDGIADVTIPWSRLAAVFVGGTDQFKIDPACMAAVKCAKLLGKWVHIGRVNEITRARNYIGIADSIDGSGLSQYDAQLSAMVELLKHEDPQMGLLE